MTDEEFLIDYARQRNNEIQMFYNQYEDKKPVMVLELPKDLLHAYTSADVKRMLPPAGYPVFEADYRRAIAQNQIMVFVIDRSRNKMLSILVDRTGDGPTQDYVNN